MKAKAKIYKGRQVTKLDEVPAKSVKEEPVKKNKKEIAKESA